MSKKKRRKNEIELADSDEVFAYIAGDTSNGVPYGITWEEYNLIMKKEQEENSSIFVDDELPF